MGDFRAMLRTRLGLTTDDAVGERRTSRTGSSFLAGASLPVRAATKAEQAGRTADTMRFQLCGWLPGWLTVKMSARRSSLWSVRTLQSRQAHSRRSAMSDDSASCSNTEDSPANACTGNVTGCRTGQRVSEVQSQSTTNDQTCHDHIRLHPVKSNRSSACYQAKLGNQIQT